MKSKKPTVEILISLQTENFFSPVRFFFLYSEKSLLPPEKTIAVEIS